jgi:hypothetical protein
VIDKGEADFIVSFELLEAARWLEFLRPGGQIVTSTQQIDPMPVITGASDYPTGLVTPCGTRAQRWTRWTAWRWRSRRAAARP